MSNIPKNIVEQIQKNDPNVHYLDLSNYGLNDDDISELQELLQKNQHINALNLANNNITSNGCKILSLISTLEKVDLSHCSIGDESIDALINAKIKDLDISYCGITEKGAKLLQQNLTKYTSLELIGNPAISHATLKDIRSKFIENSTVYSSPIGIDLGLNIHSSYEQYLSNSSAKESISREEALANKVIQEHNSEISDLTTKEKERLIMQLSYYLGVNVEIKTTFQSVLKV